MPLAPRHIGFTCMLMLAGCKPDSAGPPSRPASPPPDNSQQTSKTFSEPSPAEWHLGPGRAGVIDAETSEADLRRRYGQSVDSTRVQLGEGETAPGTVLFPGDTTRRLEIIWRDTVHRRAPARLILRGTRSQWRVGERISLGTSLQDLERLNGRPYTLAGFGWDYAGVIIDWQGGALDSALAGVKLYLDPGPAQHQSTSYSQVLGDRDYSSSLPAMQQLNPRVGQIFVDFPSTP